MCMWARARTLQPVRPHLAGQATDWCSGRDAIHRYFAATKPLLLKLGHHHGVLVRGQQCQLWYYVHATGTYMTPMVSVRPDQVRVWAQSSKKWAPPTFLRAQRRATRLQTGQSRGLRVAVATRPRTSQESGRSKSLRRHGIAALACPSSPAM
jgi:hypothetical protein